jgi:hypothetical protein
MDFWQVLKAHRKMRDRQRGRVYAWERETVGHLDHEPLLGEAADRKITQRGARQAALIYLTHLWVTYAKRYAPYYGGVPYLRVGLPRRAEDPARGGAPATAPMPCRCGMRSTVDSAA